MIVPLVTTTSIDCNLTSAKETHGCIFISDHAKLPFFTSVQRRKLAAAYRCRDFIRIPCKVISPKIIG